MSSSITGRGLPRSASGWVPGEPYVRGHHLRRRPVAEHELAPDAPVVGVLALQGDVVEHLRVLARTGARGVRVRRAEDLAGLDGIIIPGGESTTIGKLLVRFALLAPLREALLDGLPAFGTCAGMILLSRELDQSDDQPLLGVLDVVTRRNAFGRQIDSFEAVVPVVGIDGDGIRAAFIRAPWVVSVGPGVEVLARVDDHPVVVGQGHLLAASFHPEVTGDDRLHQLFVDRLAKRRNQ